MTSLQKTEANRRNARKSTGPSTPQGKAIAAKNAICHGLTANQVTAPGEDPEAFSAFAEDMAGDLAPLGPVEEALAERIAVCAWRLRRVARLEAAHATFQAQHAARAIAEGFAGWSEGLSEVGVEGHMVPLRAEVLTTLSRYEGGIERSMFKAFHELERMQARRAGEAVDPPRMVDVDVAVRRVDDGE